MNNDPNDILSNLAHDIQAQVVPFFFTVAGPAALLHLQAPGFAQGFVFLPENEGTGITFFDAGGVSAAQVTFIGVAGVIDLNHPVRTRIHAHTATVACFRINGDHSGFIFGNGLHRAGLQAFRPGALEADTGDRVPVQ